MVVVSLFVTYAIIEARRTPQWQVRLDNYVKYRNDILDKDPLISGTATVAQVIRASHPENFYKIGDKRLLVGSHDWLLEYSEKLSYPPEEVMVALLREDIRSNNEVEPEATYRVLFIVLYSQRVEPEWLIYETDNISTYLKNFAEEAPGF